MLADPAPRFGRTWLTNARLFDALMPGLIDTHAHLFATLLAAGAIE